MNTKLLALFLGFATSSLPTAAVAQSNDNLNRRSIDYVALVQSERNRSPFCSAYIGKQITSANFDALAARLPKWKPKGEFETTAQFEARQAISPTAGGPVVLTLPTDRDHMHYDADAQAITVTAGAFSAGAFSGEPQAQIAMSLATPRSVEGGTPVPYERSERLISAQVAHNRLGVPFKLTNKERYSKALYVTSSRLFASTAGENSILMGMEARPATAPQLKRTLKVALVVEPAAPYVFGGAMPGAEGTSAEPVHYVERSSVIVVKARCGLALDAQSRVLASVDAG